MSGSQTPRSEVAELARQLAHTLEDLRARWDLQYVGAAPLPAAPLPDQRSDEVASDASQGTPRTDAPTERATATTSAEGVTAPRTPSSVPTSPRAAAAAPEPSAPAAPATTARASSGSTPPDTDASATTIADPVVRAQAAKARRLALAEQAKTWSPATKLEYLRRHNVGDCQRCPLARTRNHIVFGVGNPEADIMFVGEAPGADEDRQGEPFVGRAGQLLNQWLVQLELSRQDVYISNVLKCRPPGNRDPRPEEVDKCSPFLQAQIRAIEPKVIVALGRHAGMLLSRREDLTLRAMRSSGRLSYDAGASRDDPSSRIRIPLVVTYHPAYVLRQEGDGRSLPAGRASPTEMVMADLHRALAIARPSE